MPLKAAIFDMDGLLVDSEPFWRKAEIQGFGEIGITLTEDDCRKTMGYRLDEVVALWMGAPKTVEEFAAQSAIEKRILYLVSEYIRTEARPMPGVQHAIDLCRKVGLKIAIASSSPLVLIEAVVETFGFQDTFDTIHSAQFETHGKPHPAVFLTTAQKLGVLPQECVVFEDAFHGVIAALAARMHTIAIPDPTEYSNPRYLAADFLLPSLLDLTNAHFDPGPLPRN